MARPLKEINWDLVVKKLEAGCTAKEIYNSKSTKCSHDTFYDRFKEEFGCSFQDYSIEAAENGVGDVKLMLHAKAMKGNITALMFLARCRAGMKEPENLSLVATNQSQIDQSHLIMQLKYQVAELEKKLGIGDADQPQAG